MPTRTREARASTQRQTSTSASAAAAAATNGTRTRGRPSSKASTSGVEKEPSDDDEAAAATPATPRKRVKREDNDDEDAVVKPSHRHRVKKEDPDADAAAASPETKPSPGKTLAERKLNIHRSSHNKTPYPRWPLPTEDECERVAWLLGRHHGYRPKSEGGRGLPAFQPPKGEDKFGGCGDVKDVLEATIRTILSCNTSGTNSARAHRGLTDAFGARNWQAIAEAKQKDVEESIRNGGLANNKSKSIQNLLRETNERFGSYSLQHLHDRSDAEVLETLISFSGVGPKVASCVLAFCLGRASMAVDTHVFRLCLNLGWVPPKANRDTTYYHLNVRVPDHLRYPLHVLLIQHGKVCPNCTAKGGGGAGKKAKKEEQSSGEEERDDDKEDIRNKPCPLKANGLLGRKNLKLLPEDGGDE